VRLVGCLGLELPEILERGLRLPPRLRGGELDDELGGASPLHRLDGDAFLLERAADAVAHPLDLELEGLVDVHAEDEMDAALKVESEVEGVSRRIAVEDRHQQR